MRSQRKGVKSRYIQQSLYQLLVHNGNGDRPQLLQRLHQRVQQLGCDVWLPSRPMQRLQTTK